MLFSYAVNSAIPGVLKGRSEYNVAAFGAVYNLTDLMTLCKDSMIAKKTQEKILIQRLAERRIVSNLVFTKLLMADLPYEHCNVAMLVVLISYTRGICNTSTSVLES
jgi:hypothetical protein